MSNDPGPLQRLVADIARGSNLRDLVAAAAAHARATAAQRLPGPGFRQLVASTPDTASQAAQRALDAAQAQFSAELLDGASQRLMGGH